MAMHQPPCISKTAIFYLYLNYVFVISDTVIIISNMIEEPELFKPEERVFGEKIKVVSV